MFQLWIGGLDIHIHIPDDPCMDYLPTLGEEWPHSRGNVDTYDIYLTWMVWVWLWLINQPPPDVPSPETKV